MIKSSLPSQNTIVLGYHSPTEWVFFPEVIAMYDKIVINEDIYAKVVQKGSNTSSLYRATKADLIKALVSKNVLIPMKYPSDQSKEDKLTQLVDYFFERHEESMRQLIIGAFDSFIKHEKATLEKLITTDDPHWKDVAIQIPRLEQKRKEISTGVSLVNFPHQKSVVKRYFEDSFLTPVAYKSGYNPVFQWEGYAEFEQFLLGFRKGEKKRKEKIEKGSELRVIRSLSDIILPFRVIKSPDEIENVVSKWDSFAEIRQYASSINDQVWSMIETENVHSDKERKDFVSDFNSFLSVRLSNLNHKIKELDVEIEKEYSSTLSKITKLIIATLGSIIPGTAGMGQIIDDAHSSLVANNVKDQYQGLRVVFEYERILSEIKSKHYESKHIVTLGDEYETVSYWDNN